MKKKRLFKMVSRKAAGSLGHRGVRFGTLRVAGRPRTTREAIFSSRLVAEVAHARQNHRHPLLICGFDDFGIAD